MAPLAIGRHWRPDAATARDVQLHNDMHTSTTSRFLSTPPAEPDANADASKDGGRRPFGYVLLALYAATVTAAVYHRAEIAALVSHMATSSSWLGGLILVAIVAVIVALGLPAGATYVACGALLGSAGGTAVSLLGSFLGSTLAFASLRSARESARRWLPLERSTYRAIERAVEREGAPLIAWLRLSPFVPVSVVNASSAFLGVSWRTFFISLPASGLAAVAFALSGAIGGAALEGDLGWRELISGALVASSTIGMVFAASSVRRALEAAGGADTERPADAACLSVDSRSRDPRDEDRDDRTIGVELELVSLDVAGASEIVAAVFDGQVRPGESSVERVVDTELGEFRVERDSAPYKRAAARRDARERQGEGGAISPGSLRDEALLQLGGPFVPTEIVSPPIAIELLAEVDRLVDGLRDAGAKGTRRSPVDALGLHLNPEALRLDAEGILATMRAYFLLRDRLREGADIDVARKASGFIDRHGDAYVERVLDPEYAPTLDELVRDYVELVGSRNRDLDLLPLFAHLRPKITATLDDARIKPRPTYHYRLPNCDLGREGWSVGLEWRRWRLVEALASEPRTLALWLRADGAPDAARSEASIWADERMAREARWA